MKRITMMLSMGLLLGLVTGAAAKPVKMSLQIRKGDLRSAASFLSKVVGSAAYGDRFIVEETKGAWSRVKSESGTLSGWLHNSALTRKRIKLKAGDKDAEVAASSGELALAGKGFNSDVEAQFKEQNKEADFDAVDLMEKILISTREMQKFLKVGKVVPKGGAE